MPLYNLNGASYLGALKYFNEHSSNSKMGVNELRAVLQKAGIDVTKCNAGHVMQEMINMISVDGDGINCQAFVDFVATHRSLRDTESEYQEAFRIYDRTGTGNLRTEDIEYVMVKLGCQDFKIKELMDKCDTNKDGVISYEEFCDMMRIKF